MKEYVRAGRIERLFRISETARNFDNKHTRWMMQLARAPEPTHGGWCVSPPDEDGWREHTSGPLSFTLLEENGRLRLLWWWHSHELIER